MTDKSKPGQGKIVRKGKRLSIREALPDNPIYTRGVVYVGGFNYRSTSRNNPANRSGKPKRPNTK